MKVLRLVSLIMILAAIPTGARAQQSETPAFGGYEVVASGAAFSAFPSASGQVVENPAEATISLSLATLNTGDEAFARASTLYPGDLIARFEAILKFFGPAPDLPDYPIVAEAREFDEPQDSSTPGATMHAEADSSRASAVAESRFGNEQLSVGSASSVSTSAFDGGSLAATTETTVSDIALGDVVTIGQVRSSSTSITDGATASCSGEVVVTGLTIAGQEATISRDGVHADGEPVIPGADPDQALRDVLDGAGITLRVIGAQSDCGTGAAANHSTAGLLISMPAPQAGAVEATMNMVFGQAHTAVSATEAATFDPGEFVPGSTGGDDDSSESAVRDSVPRTPGPAAGGGSSEPVQEVTESSPVESAEGSAETSDVVPAFETEEVSYDFHGVPATLAIGLVLGSIPVVRLLRRYMNRLLAMGSAA